MSQNIIIVSEDSSSLQGTLKLIVKDAKLKRDVNTFTTMDPYVQIKVAKSIYKTKVAKDGGKNPRWNEEFELICNDPSEILELKVMEESLILSDDDIGHCQIKLSQLMHGNGVTEWFILLWKNKKAGEILLQSIWDGPSRT
jgi:Ca2+-dependent lipid-binding protein